MTRKGKRITVTGYLYMPAARGMKDGERYTVFRIVDGSGPERNLFEVIVDGWLHDSYFQYSQVATEIKVEGHFERGVFVDRYGTKHPLIRVRAEKVTRKNEHHLPSPVPQVQPDAGRWSPVLF